MNKYHCLSVLWVVVCTGLLSVLCSCEKKPGASTPRLTDLPVLIKNEKNWSLYHLDGTFLCENSLDGMPSLVINDIFSRVNPDSTYSLWRVEDKPVVVNGCRRLLSVGWNNSGLIPVCTPGARIQIIDTLGNIKFTLNPIDGVEIMETALTFWDDMLRIITVDGKYGFVDRQGKVVIAPKYYVALDFSEGKALVEIPGKTSDSRRLYRFIDKTGRTLFDVPDSIRLETFRYRYDKVVAHTVSGRVGFLNKEGKFENVIPDAEGIGNYNSKYYAFVIDGRWGVADFKGRIKIPAQYQTIEMLPDESFLVLPHHGKYLVLDCNGIQKFEFDESSYVKFVPKIGFICKTPKGFKILNKNGRREVPEYFKNISLNRSASKAVRSQWYNPSSIFSQLGDKISAYGVGKFKIGLPYYHFIRKDASKDLVTTKRIPELFVNSDSVKFRVTAYTNKPIAKYIATKEGAHQYEFNKDALLKILQIDIFMKKDTWRSEQLAFETAMLNKGYAHIKTIDRGGVSYHLYKHAHTELLVFYSEPQKQVRIYVVDEDSAYNIKQKVLKYPGIPKD